MVTLSDGSSTVMTGSGRGSSGSASVSPIVTSAVPPTAVISPGPAPPGATRPPGPGAGLLGRDALQGLGDVELADLRARHGPVRATPRDLLAAANRPVAHATQ